MVHKDINTLRAEILTDSLKTANEPKYGYFGFAPPLAIGDNSQAAGKTRKSKEEEEAELLKSFVIGPPRKGAGPDTLFKPMEPLCNGDPYIDPFKRLLRKKCTPVDPEQMFKPPGTVKHATSKGVTYVPQGTNKEDPKAIYQKYKETEFAILHPPNIKTSNLKKGGGGVLTGGVLLSNFPEHMPDNYDGAKEQKRKELEEHASKVQEAAFKSMAYGGRVFGKDAETFGFPREGEGAIVSAQVPRKINIDVAGATKHEQAFRPANPSKKGFNGLMGWPDEDPAKPPLGFPKWVADPIPQPSRRRPEPDVAPPPPFCPSHGGNLDNPMKSVVMMTRNLRISNPASFVRPKI